MVHVDGQRMYDVYGQMEDMSGFDMNQQQNYGVDGWMMWTEGWSLWVLTVWMGEGEYEWTNGCVSRSVGWNDVDIFET